MNDLKGKKIAILTEDGFEEIELTSPLEALKDAGAEVLIVSPKNGKVKAKSGDDWTKEYDVDLQLNDAKSGEFDALVIPGGVINPDKLRTNKDALQFVQTFFNENKPVAAICHGPQVLINAEAVRNKKLTSVGAIEADLKNAGAQWEDQEVVVDGNLITSRTPKDLPAFNKATIEAIAKA
ncbi:type 1 glutamine amidotransferase [Flavobacterium sp. CBA20B-1]|uniref:type 1 glutamine amidotransferase domain-containing protein n=1 Tax=unclassified Flavobacterium TaxID=196869 RepID=UPI002225A789|nr:MULTISPECIES: type 1 glutamine amidotransferase domain-containing protein [unclassified Flavobacterium]WCM41162.1 type 1 glutamine amidotransferase [Flavobacterium sp. CBA20B-1]